MNFSSFCDQAHSFLNKIFQEIETSNLLLEPHWMIDHLCFRVETQAEYDLYKKYFSEFSSLLIESPVNGRQISTYKLKEPIYFKNYQIGLVELPAPKSSKKVSTGFEHFEVVCDLSFSEIEEMSRNCDVDKSGLSKIFNKEFEVKFKSGSVKFHHLSLESVIYLERHPMIFKAITESKMLELLAIYNPLIVGSVPLGLGGPESDIDILLCTSKLQSFENFVLNILSKKFELSLNKKHLQNHQSLIIQYNYLGINFELFVQEVSTTRQPAYRHFLAEERLLMLGGIKFYNKIKSLRENGLKTEAAFAKALGLEQDPYLELERIQKISEKNLISRFFS